MGSDERPFIVFLKLSNFALLFFRSYDSNRKYGGKALERSKKILCADLKKAYLISVGEVSKMLNNLFLFECRLLSFEYV